MQALCGGTTVELFPQGAVFLPAERMLLVADLHLGKTATFRSAGIAVPEGGMDEDLAQLSTLCASTGAESLLVLGDFFHAPAGRTKSMLNRCERWAQELRATGVRILLVMGNHDRSSGRPPVSWGMEVHDEQLVTGPFTMIHEALGEEPGFSFSGHVHPAVRLRGGGMKVPCFWQSASGMVLPAFGSFTGTHAVRPGKGDSVWGISEGTIAEIPAILWS